MAGNETGPSNTDAVVDQIDRSGEVTQPMPDGVTVTDTQEKLAEAIFAAADRGNAVGD